MSGPNVPDTPSSKIADTAALATRVTRTGGADRLSSMLCPIASKAPPNGSGGKRLGAGKYALKNVLPA